MIQCVITTAEGPGFGPIGHPMREWPRILCVRGNDGRGDLT